MLLPEKNFFNIIVTTITKIKNIKTDVSIEATYSSSVKSKYKSTAKIANKIEQISKLRLIIGNSNHKDTLKMIVELSNDKNDIKNLIIDEIKAELKLRADVEVVAKGKIPNDGLVIEDTRTYE